MTQKINEKILQYQNSATETYNIKTEEDAQKEYENFKSKLKAFRNVKTVSEAKELAKKFLPVNNEINYLLVGNAKCVIISRRNLLRIVLKKDKEMVCYNFRVKENQNARHQ